MSRVTKGGGSGNTDSLTDAELRATPVPVTVDGGIQTDGLTDAELRATPVPVSGTVSTGGLTDTQLRASAVPVSGPLTDTQLRASAVPVDTELPAAGALSDALTNPTTPLVGAASLLYRAANSSWQRQRTADGSSFPTNTGIGRALVAPNGSLIDLTQSGALTSILVSTITDLGSPYTSWVFAAIITGSPTACSIAISGGDMAASLGVHNSNIITWDALNTNYSVGTSIIRVGSRPASALTAHLTVLTGGTSPTVKIYALPLASSLEGERWIANGTETTVDNTSGGVQVAAAVSPYDPLNVVLTSARRTLVLQNTGTAPCRIGVSGITATTGLRLDAGATITLSGADCPINAVYAIRDGSVSTTVLAQELRGG